MRTPVCTENNLVLFICKCEERKLAVTQLAHPSEFYIFHCQEKQLWSLEPPGSMEPMGTRSTTWQRRTGCWSTPLMGRGAWDASACSLRTAWLTTRPAPEQGSPKTWWRSSVICTTRWAWQADAAAWTQSGVRKQIHAPVQRLQRFYDRSECQQSAHKTIVARAACWIFTLSYQDWTKCN